MATKILDKGRREQGIAKEAPRSGFNGVYFQRLGPFFNLKHTISIVDFKK